jgi:hypothetical protein
VRNFRQNYLAEIRKGKKRDFSKRRRHFTLA